MSLCEQWCPTSVQVTVLQARGLRSKGKSGTNDAYALMQVGKERYQTSVVEKSVAPVWKEEAAFDLPQSGGGGSTERSTLHVHVLHRALVGPDKLLGQAVINLQQLSEDKTRDKTQWFKLLDKTGKADKDRGEVLVDIQFMRNNMTASMFDLSAAGKSRSRLGKFKDKVRGKKKELDAASIPGPSFSQVLTDSEEEEGNGDGEVAAGKDLKKKKKKIKSLFSPKSNLQRNMSQSMSVLPAKNFSLSQSSGLNVDPSEGKKKFKFKIHKRSGSSDSKDSSSHLKYGAAEQSNMCINGSHIYCDEPPSRNSRIGSDFSLASSGHGSMEDVPEISAPSVDSLKVVRQCSPWEEEEEETSETNIKEEEEEEGTWMEEKSSRKDREQEDWLVEEERTQERTRIQEEEKRAEEERIRMEEERAQQVRRQEEERTLADEKKRKEEEERTRNEEKVKKERKRREEEERAQEERRRQEEEEMARSQEELRRLAEEKRRTEEEERRRVEEEKAKKEEERILREEEERAQEERRRQEEEEIARRLEELRILAEEKRRIEEEEIRRVEEEKAKKEEERILREEEERAQEERRRQEEEEIARRLEELGRLAEENRRIEEEERRRVEEEKAKKEEEMILREEEERAQEERRRQEEECKRLAEEKMRLEIEERKRIEKEEENQREERIRMEERRRQEEEYILAEEKKRLEEDRRRQEEEKARKEEEERIQREEEAKAREEEMMRRQEKEHQEKMRLVEQERRLKEQEEKKRKREDEEKALREKEECQRLEEEKMKLKEKEKERIEAEEKIRKEKEERIRVVEEKKNEEERRTLEKQERMRIEEEEKRQREEVEIIRKEEERREEEERARKEREDYERLVQEERSRKAEEEAMKLDKEKLTQKTGEQQRTRNKMIPTITGMRSAEDSSYNPFDEISDNPNSLVEHHSNAAGPSKVQQRCQPVASLLRSRTASSEEKDAISTQRERRPAPQPPGRNQDQSQREPEASAQHLAPINKQSADVKSISVDPQRSVPMIAPLSRSPTEAKNTQSITQNSPAKGTIIEAKHSKGPAPSRPRPVEKGTSPGPKTASSSDGEIPDKHSLEMKQELTVRSLNPFEDNEDEVTTNVGSIWWPPAVSQAADKDAASQAKIKSSKKARAPPLPANTATIPSTSVFRDAAGGLNAGVTACDNSATHPCDPKRVPESPVQESQLATVQSPVKTGGKKEGLPPTPRRLQPVKPLNPLGQLPVSVVQGEIDNKSTGQTKVDDTGVKGPYSQLTRAELISLLLKQENQLSERDRKISELEQYIDNLLVRVIEEKPSILMSMSALTKTV